MPGNRIHVCTYCGSLIVLPEPLRNLYITPAEAIVIVKLWNKLGKVLQYNEISNNRKVVHVRVCRVREALREVGAPYTIKSVTNQGYVLVKNEVSE